MTRRGFGDLGTVTNGLRPYASGKSGDDCEYTLLTPCPRACRSFARGKGGSC